MIFTLIASSFGGDIPIDLFIELLLPLYIGGIFLFYLIRGICLWGVFKKADKTPWVALIPIVNFIVLLEITEKPKTWIIGLFFPIINYVLYFVVYIELAKKFDKSAWFGVGMVLLPFIFLPLIAFGDARFKGKKEIFYDDDILDRG
ncbi:DUF5684 domain-containing protein [Bernardetia sp. ABR2-2B]|uniref:DUF5684 domain-containing protein n=1 Tax=Bernardetia sp. ABR2-2B TaxID=3127472 RepID=UPI0030D4762C